MSEVLETEFSADLMSLVRALISSRFDRHAHHLDDRTHIGRLLFGKMLRTRLASRLAGHDCVRLGRSVLGRVCAAVEMAHAASLCHDDVIDGAVVRRGRASLWRQTSPSAAVLVGDLLFCKAFALLLETEGGRYARIFLDKVSEMCEAETEHELSLRGEILSEETCLRINRGKTGPLFGLVGHVCGGKDSVLSGSLEEAGYRIGTAYQLADDLCDAIGNEKRMGKTLGTDSARGKFTLPQLPFCGEEYVRDRIDSLLNSSLECVSAYLDTRRRLADFIVLDLKPVLEAIHLTNVR